MSCRGGDGSAGTQPALPACLQHRGWGRRGGEGPGRVTVLQPEILPQPQHGGGGEAGSRSNVRVEEGVPLTTKVSSGLKRRLAADRC